MSIAFTNMWILGAVLVAAAPTGAQPGAAPASTAPNNPPKTPKASRKSDDLRGCAAELRPTVQAALDRLKRLEQQVAVEVALRALHEATLQTTRRRLAELAGGATLAKGEDPAALQKRVVQADAGLVAVSQRIVELQAEASVEQDLVDAVVDEPAANLRERTQRRRCVRSASNARIEAQIERETRSFRGAMVGARASRCATAICWGPSNKFAFEPLAELPIGKSFAFPGSGLARYVNGNDIQVSFNAGVRFWLAWDWVSFGVYLSKPLLQGGDSIHVSGSTHEFATSQVRRPGPGLGVGLFGDMLWLSFDYDQLRNGNAGNLRAPEFPQNALVSHAYVFTVAIAPLAGLRNGLGSLGEKKRREAEAAAQKAAEAEARKEEEAKAAAAQKAAEEKVAAGTEGPSEPVGTEVVPGV